MSLVVNVVVVVSVRRMKGNVSVLPSFVLDARVNCVLLLLFRLGGLIRMDVVSIGLAGVTVVFSSSVVVSGSFTTFYFSSAILVTYSGTATVSSC